MLVYYSGWGSWCDIICDENDKLFLLPISGKEHVAGLFTLEDQNALDIEYKGETNVFTLKPCYTHEHGISLKGYTAQDEICFSIDNQKCDSDLKETHYTQDKIIREQTEKNLDTRSETAYLNIIAALLDCISGDGIPNIERHPSFKNQSELINKISDLYSDYYGLSKRNLSRKFPEAKDTLKNS